MAKRNPNLDWDKLLNGETHTLNLDVIGWERGLNDLRAKIHYEADKRRAVAHTHKIDAATLEFHAEGARPLKPARSGDGCTCGGGAQGPHVITCPVLQTWPTPLLDEGHPDYVPPSGRTSTPTDNTSTPTSEPLAADDEALLGPCTCGQAPMCAPDCARVASV